MQRYEDRSSMQEPGVCFICELSPSDGVGVVDTLSNFAPGFPSSLSGRKYVCDGCVKGVAEASGYFATSTVEEANRVADEATARYNAVRDHVASAVKELTDEKLVFAGDKSAQVAAVAAPVEVSVTITGDASAVETKADVEPSA